MNTKQMIEVYGRPKVSFSRSYATIGNGWEVALKNNSKLATFTDFFGDPRNIKGIAREPLDNVKKRRIIISTEGMPKTGGNYLIKNVGPGKVDFIPVLDGNASTCNSFCERLWISKSAVKAFKRKGEAMIHVSPEYGIIVNGASNGFEARTAIITKAKQKEKPWERNLRLIRKG